jgi:hypothetical protein
MLLFWGFFPALYFAKMGITSNGFSSCATFINLHMTMTTTMMMIFTLKNE